MVENVTPNSHTYKEEKKQEEIIEVAKVASGKLAKKKRVKSKLFSELFLCDDFDSVKKYVIDDLIKPALRDTIVDIIQKTTDMVFYGKTNPSRSRSRISLSNGTGGNFMPYNSFSSRQPVRNASPASRMLYDFDDIYFDTREDAMDVKNVLLDLIDNYGKATVAQYYRASDVTGNGYTDNNYGWRDLSSAWVEEIRIDRETKYVLNLPRCIDIRDPRR